MLQPEDLEHEEAQEEAEEGPGVEEQMVDMTLKSGKEKKTSKRKNRKNGQKGNEPKIGRSSAEQEDCSRPGPSFSLDYNSGSFRSAVAQLRQLSGRPQRHPRPSRSDPYLVRPSSDPYITRPIRRPDYSHPPPPPHWSNPRAPHPSSQPPMPPARWREGYQDPRTYNRPGLGYPRGRGPPPESGPRDTYRRPGYEPRTHPDSGFGIYRNLRR